MKDVLTKGQRRVLEQMRDTLAENPTCKYATLDLMTVSLADNRLATLSIRLTPVE